MLKQLTLINSGEIPIASSLYVAIVTGMKVGNGLTW